MILNSTLLKWSPLVGFFVIVLLFLFNATPHSGQEFLVKKLVEIESLETHNLYMYILIGSIFFPFILSFDKRVKFYTKWIPLIKATILPALIFILWDIIFTKNEIWGFNQTYISGIKIMGLPLEEILWFFIIPYCCVFIYECVIYYINPRWNEKLLRGILILMLIIMVGVILFNIDHIYTALTFTTGAFFCIIMLNNIRNQFVAGFLSTWLISLIPLIIVNGVLTGAFTKEPIVTYSSDAIIGIRIISIPIEDTIYLWSYLFIILWMFEIYKKKEKKGNLPNTKHV